MKILTLHCDYVKFQATKKALKSIPDLSEKDKKEQEVKETLVVLTAIEQGDSDTELSQSLKAIKKTAKEVKTESIVLYPYAHLSSNLAPPQLAQSLLKKAESLLSKSYKVTRAPFGYYKTFELKCKGHPLAELSKEFSSQVTISSQPIKSNDKEENISHLLNQISRSKLDTSKLKPNDHRILGQQLDLFSFNESAPGAVFWHPNGLIVYNEIINFMKELLIKDGYKEISTPQILDNKLWKVSGHWDHYKDNMFLTEYEGKKSALKPMSCPGAMLVYRTNTRSYKDLPLRLAEFGVVHRQELSGVLSGLLRVIRITQDDAHTFCTKEQVGPEIESILKMMDIVFKKTFNMDYTVELSTRPKKFMGEKKDWDEAEKSLESILKKLKIKYKVNKGDGAFYGPKIDVHIKDSLSRTWQTTTIQLDMQLPERFEIKYTGKDNKEHTPLVIHRTIFGSLERFIGILLEHTSGALPLWLSPTQVRVINFTDRNSPSVLKTIKELQAQIPNIRIDSDLRSTPLPEKIRDAELLKIPYTIVIGDKEESSKTLAVRTHGDKNPKFKVSISSFIKELREKITNRT
jgi:threonyl-tRNA synthetase